ncbi:hypothetical protein NQ317_004598 [Molorchus minor]|uniref:RNase H type-1 domain-containing protein n=1 Tax=Molorchus minor TaxID=1323400 RepID=A0ABQ9J2W8_9CUCU|nr:hypothetical protein NQ317_004598 [Molorchus minor]
MAHVYARPHHMLQTEEEVLDIVEDDPSTTEGLRVNSGKADLVIFTRKRKLGILPEIQLAVKVITYKGSTKYLGSIELKLTWHEHIATRSKKQPLPFGSPLYSPILRLENLNKAPKGRTIQIFSDSWAALLAIESSKVKSRLVLECKKTLNDLASRNKVILTWVPGHSGVQGNEEADRLAREGSAMYPIGPEPILGLTKCLLGMNRRDIRMVTGLLTGHCHLSRHLQLIGIAEGPECRWCLEDTDTSSHVLIECPAIARVRERHFGSSVLNSEDV